MSSLPKSYWIKCKSTKRSAYYYHDTVAQLSVWEEPEGVEIHEKSDEREKAQRKKKLSMKNDVHNDDLDDEYLEILKKSKSQNAPKKYADLDDELQEILNKSKSQNPPKEDCVLKINQNLKRKNEESVEHSFNKDTSSQSCSKGAWGDNVKRPKHTTRQLLEVSSKLERVFHQQSPVRHFVPNEKSKKSSPKYSKNNLITRKTHTPIQDKFDKRKEDLLKKQQKKNSEVTVAESNSDSASKPFAEEKLINYRRNEELKSRACFKTPIQDKFNKKKEELLKKQLEKKCEQKPYVSPIENENQSVACSSNQVISKRYKEDQPLDQVHTNNVSNSGVKRKASSFEERRCNNNGWAENNTTAKYFKRRKSPVRDQTFYQNHNKNVIDLNREASPIEGGFRRHRQGINVESYSTVEEQKTFDLRMKIQQRKEDKSHTSQPDVSSQMEWEPSYPRESFHREVSGYDDRKNVIKNESPVQESSSSYKNIYLVCDTSALLHDQVLVESLIAKGSYLGLPLTIVIPFVVLDELDRLKVKEDVGHRARQISRIIQSSQSSAHLHLQDGGKKREAVGSLELKVNDDLVLNCGLQMREACGKFDLAVLMTTDVILGNKATSFKLQSHNWNSFKRWARGFRECKRTSFSPRRFKQESPLQMKRNEGCLRENEEKMDIDTVSLTSVNNIKSPDDSYCDSKEKLVEENDKLPIDTAHKPPKNTQLQNCIQSHLEELKSDFQTFLHNILEEALEKEYGNLKRHTNNIRPSWTVLDYIAEIQRRWFLITSSTASNKVLDILSHLKSTFKKHNSGKEELKVSDVDNQFNLCNILANMIAKNSHYFLGRLATLKEEWKEAHRKVLSTNALQNMVEEDVQAMDVALQNIYNCLHSDYEAYKKQIENNENTEDILNQLPELFKKIEKLESAMKMVFQENPVALSCSNEAIIRLHELVTNFSSVKGSPFGFELVFENVIELFQDMPFRKIVKQRIDKFQKLKYLVDGLLCIFD